MRKNSNLVGIILIIFGVFLTLAAFGDFFIFNLSQYILPLFLVLIAIYGLYKIDFFIFLLAVSLLVVYYQDRIGIELNSSFYLVLAAGILGVGLNMIFGRYNRQEKRVKNKNVNNENQQTQPENDSKQTEAKKEEEQEQVNYPGIVNYYVATYQKDHNITPTPQITDLFEQEANGDININASFQDLVHESDINDLENITLRNEYGRIILDISKAVFSNLGAHVVINNNYGEIIVIVSKDVYVQSFVDVNNENEIQVVNQVDNKITNRLILNGYSSNGEVKIQRK